MFFILMCIFVLARVSHAVFVFSFPRTPASIFIPTLQIDNIHATRVVEDVFICFEEMSQTPSTDFWYNGTYTYEDDDRNEPGTYIDVWFPSDAVLQDVFNQLHDEPYMIWSCLCRRQPQRVNCSHLEISMSDEMLDE